jgi:hypothetical protein
VVHNRFHQPERRERLLRHSGQGAEPPRPRHRSGRHNICRRVDHSMRGLGQRPHPWPAVSGPVSQNLGAHVGRGHREVPCLRHDPRHRPDLRQEAAARPAASRRPVRRRDHYDPCRRRGGRDVTRRNITIFGLGIIPHRRAASLNERVPCEGSGIMVASECRC